MTADIPMLVFLDDSGDPGFKLDKGSTKYFIIAMVIFDDDLEAEKTAIAIKELRRELKWPDYREFRFYKSSRDIRLRFLEKIKHFNFRIRALVVDKSIIRSDELRANKDKFYAYFIKEVLKHSGLTIKDAKVKIDGSGERIFPTMFLGRMSRSRHHTETVQNTGFCISIIPNACRLSRSIPPPRPFRFKTYTSRFMIQDTKRKIRVLCFIPCVIGRFLI